MRRATFSRRHVLGSLGGLGITGFPTGGAAMMPGFSLHTTARDKTIVDPRTGLTFSGTARPGTTVDLRFHDPTGPVSEWYQLAKTSARGVWSGKLPPLPRDTGWVQPELRLRDDAADGSGALLEARLASGYVVAIWGQSELHRAVLPAHAALDRVPRIENPETLQVTFSASAADDYGDQAQFVHSAVTENTPVSAHMASLSNLLAKAAPRERFHFIFHTRAGTGLQQLLDDRQPGRRWSDDIALMSFALPAGQRPGLAWTSWYNSDAALAQNYGRVLFAALTGRNADGTALNRGAIPQGGRLAMDHVFPDIYGPETRWAVAGPHRFEMDKFDGPIAACRAAVNRMFQNPHLPHNIHRALEPLTYLNGNPRWNGDFSHPDSLEQPQDGLTRLMLLMGNSVLRQLGLARWSFPEFDRARLIDNGGTLEIWSTSGPVRTTRTAQGESPSKESVAVQGFTIDGLPARHVSLEGGRVRVRHDNLGAPFPRGTRIAFGAGGIGSENLQRDTRERQVWRDYPIVDVGQTGLEGIPVKAQTSRRVLDIIPPMDRVTDPAPSGNLLPLEIARFAETSRPPGWVRVAPGWRLDASEGTATSRAETDGALVAATPRGASGMQPGTRALLSFVPETEGLAPEILQIIVAATGGGTASDLFRDEVVLTPGRRMSLRLQAMPRNRNGLSITFRRRGHPTGLLILGSLGLYPVI